MTEEIKNLEYFRKKLKTFLKKYDDDNIITIRDKETRDNLEKMINQIEKHINSVKNDLLYNYKHYFIDLIETLNQEIEFNRNQIKPIRTDFRPYNEKAYSKLNYLFRKDNILSGEEIKNNCDDFEWLQNKCNIFLELINWLNDNKLSIIPEKTLFSAYLGISVDYYNDLLNNASDVKIRNLLKSIDEYFTTNQFGALISDDRKSLERIQKTKTYGQEMLQTQPDVLNVNTTNVLSLSDIKKQIESKKKNIIDYKVEE